MEKRRFGPVLLVCLTLLAATVVARADEPSLPAQSNPHRARKKPRHKTPAPKSSDACASDDDCALSRYEDGQCCATRCQGRAVNKQSADALIKFAKACGERCPVVDCAPPAMSSQVACVSGRCVARAAPSPARE